jgi:hypothetical protein
MSKKLRNWGEEKKQDILIPETPPKTPAKKNTKRWCKGKVGVEHFPQVELSHYYAGSRTRMGKPTCYRSDQSWRGNKQVWLCSHCIRCANCRKILHEAWDMEPSQCPLWDGKPKVIYE